MKNSQKLMVTLLALAFSITPTLNTSTSFAATTTITNAQTAGKIVKAVNFRNQASTSGTVLRTLQVGESVTIIDKPNASWYQVKDKNGVTGYISSDSQYISISNSSESSSSSTLNTGKIVKAVNFRNQASTSGTVLRTLQTGESVTIVDKPNASWYQVKDKNGVTGYISSDSQYISISNSSESSSSSVLNTGKIVKAVHFRNQASSSGTVLRTLQAGESVTIVDKPSGYWYQIKDKNGVTGYISSDSQYMSVSNSSASSVSMDSSDSSSSNTSTSSTRSQAAQKAITAGKKYLGTPYLFGADRSSTKVFDCSSFVRRAFIDGIGLTLPPDSRQQGDYVKNIGLTTTNVNNLQPGDLMFFMDYKGTKASDYASINKSKATITHVGIYIGNGEVLHTYSTDSGGVRTNKIAGSAWEYRFLFGGSAVK